MSEVRALAARAITLTPEQFTQTSRTRGKLILRTRRRGARVSHAAAIHRRNSMRSQVVAEAIGREKREIKFSTRAFRNRSSASIRIKQHLLAGD